MDIIINEYFVIKYKWPGTRARKTCSQKNNEMHNKMLLLPLGVAAAAVFRIVAYCE